MKYTRLTDRATGKTIEIPVKDFKRIAKKFDPESVKEKYEIVEFEKEFPRFTFECWIHPKEGGDDYQEIVEYECETQEIAEKALKKSLKRKSGIDNDYRLIENKARS